MTVTLPDGDRKLREISELSRTTLRMRDDYLRKNREKLMPVFQEYVAATVPITHPSYHAILLGFKEAWLKGDFETILLIGQKLPREFIEHYKEILGFLGGALNQAKRKKPS